MSHNGGIIPVPGRDLYVQGWYQGGINLFDDRLNLSAAWRYGAQLLTAIALLAVRGTPKRVFNVHLDTVPSSPGWSADPHVLRVGADRHFRRRQDAVVLVRA